MIFVRYLTAVVLCMHALLGCCWHHAHACTLSHASPVAPAVKESVEAAHREHAHATCSHDHPLSGPISNGAPGEDSDHRHECQGDRCVFVRIEATRIPPLASLCAAPEFGQLPCQQAVVGNSDGSWAAADGSLAAAPVRLHLLHEVLLI